MSNNNPSIDDVLNQNSQDNTQPNAPRRKGIPTPPSSAPSEPQENFVPLQTSAKKSDPFAPPSLKDKMKMGLKSAGSFLGKKMKPATEVERQDIARRVGRVTERATAETIGAGRSALNLVTGTTQGLLQGLAQGGATITSPELKVLRSITEENTPIYVGEVIGAAQVSINGTNVNALQVALAQMPDGSAAADGAVTQITLQAGKTARIYVGDVETECTIVPLTDEDDNKRGYLAVVRAEDAPEWVTKQFDEDDVPAAFVFSILADK